MAKFMYPYECLAVIFNLNTMMLIPESGLIRVIEVQQQAKQSFVCDPPKTIVGPVLSEMTEPCVNHCHISMQKFVLVVNVYGRLRT